MKELEDIIKDFKLEEIVYFEEKYDRQFLALKKLYNEIRDKKLFLKLVILNAINSFQLKMSGEEFWETFANYFSKHKDLGKFPEFLEKYNNRFLELKKKRYEKIRKWLDSIDVFEFKNLKNFVEEISKILSQRKSNKTIVFTAKMLNYAFRIIGIKTFFEDEILIPIDYRIGKISKELNFWKKIAQKTKIPLIYIDSLIWVTFKLDVDKIEEKELKEKIKKLKKFLEEYVLRF